MSLIRLWVLALGTFAVGTDLFVIAGLLPDVARGLHSSPAAAGFLVTVFALAYAIGSPILASLTGAISRKRVLVFSIGFFALANAVAAVSPNYLWLLASRVAAAMGAALYTPSASSAAVALMKPEARGKALAVVLGGMTAATVLGVPIGTEVGTLFSWRMTFALLTVLGVASAAFTAILLPDVHTPRSVGFMDRMRVMWRPRVLQMLSLTFLWSMGGFTVYTYRAVFLRHPTGISGAGLSGILLWFGLSAMAGNYAGGAGADRLGSYWTIGLGLFVLTPVFGALRWSASTAFEVVVSVGLWGIAGWVFRPLNSIA